MQTVKIKKIIGLTAIFSFLFVSVFFAVQPIFVSADEYGLKSAADEAKLKTSATLPQMVGNVLGTALSLVGVLFFALMIYGGIMWMTARGNTETSKKALDTIVAAIIGLIIVLSSYAITDFVFKSVESTSPGNIPTTNPTTPPAPTP